MWHDRADEATPSAAVDPAVASAPRFAARPSSDMARPADARTARSSVFLVARAGDHRVRPGGRGPDHAVREVVDVRIDLRLVQLGDRHGARAGRFGLRDIASRAAHRLVPHPVRGRHAGDDHRRARRAGHRFPAQGGSGLGCFRVSRTTSSSVAGTLQRATSSPSWRATTINRRSSCLPISTRTRPATGCTSSAASRRMTRTSSVPASRMHRPRSSSRATPPTMPTCTRS